MLLRCVSRQARATSLLSSGARCASSLVLAEHDSTSVSNGTLSAVAAAKKLGGPVTLLLAGTGSAAVAKSAAAISGVDKLLVVEDASLDHGLAEPLANLLVAEQKRSKYSHILADASSVGKNVLPRAAIALDVAPLSDVTAVVDEHTFERPMYAGNAIARVKSGDSLKVMTVRPTAFEKAARTGGTAAVETISAPAPSGGPVPTWVKDEVAKSERPELGAASIIVSGGRALKSGENFKILYDLADRLGAAVGASRAAVDAGYVPNELQVGQTGKVVAPNLYIAVGISGAIQHLAGMKDSKVIVAINKDAEAPIFQVADYGLVADLFVAVPELASKLPAR